MTALVYLAAGNSRRFGSNKLLYEIDGKPMFRHTLERLSSVAKTDEGCRLCVVTQYEQIADYAEKIGAKAVLSPKSKDGISYSIKAGVLSAREAGADSAVFFVADQPFLTEKTILDFVLSAKRSKRGIACVSWQGELGNPVYFTAKYFQYLEELTGDSGGKKVVKRFLCDVFSYEVESPDELKDIDSLE